MESPSTPAPRAGIKAGAIVASEQAELVGDVTIGTHSVISQACSILAIDGPIVIGDSNLVEERVEIINKAGEDGRGMGETMFIGNDNVFEIGSVCRALKVGDNNVFEIKSQVGRDVEVTNGCIIGIKCTVDGEQVLPERTVVFGDECQRRVMGEKPSLQTLQLDFLRKVFSKEGSLKKPGSSSVRRVTQTRLRPRTSMSSDASTPAAKQPPT